MIQHKRVQHKFNSRRGIQRGLNQGEFAPRKQTTLVSFVVGGHHDTYQHSLTEGECLGTDRSTAADARKDVLQCPCMEFIRDVAKTGQHTDVASDHGLL